MKRDGGGGRVRHPLCRCAAAIKQVDRKQERNIRNSEDYDFFPLKTKKKIKQGKGWKSKRIFVLSDSKVMLN